MDAGGFVDWYQNLEVPKWEWTVATISINKYITGFDNTGPKAQARNRVQAAAKAKRLDVRDAPFARAHSGKVSPLDCEHILNLAIESEAVKPESLQGWADTNLGVDCTGFVVAFYSWLKLIDIDKYSGGASCFTLLGKAKNNNRPGDGGPLLWDLEDVEVDDMIIWMTEAQVETRTPGHIAVIYDVDYELEILYTAESRGGNDGQGHFGPQFTERTWDGVKGNKGSRYVQLAKTDKVLVVRPPATFG